ncbi:MAG: hypothetical protein K6G76_06010 [Lachnospiraceae bacterium]|nr:hypothetical protein [Lachnospiraceae bacterium]
MVSGIESNNAYVSSASSAAQAPVKADKAATQSADTAAKEAATEGVVYDKGAEKVDAKAPYSINKMSKEDRDALVKQLKDDELNRQQSLLDIVNKTLGQQATKFTLANLTGEEDDSFWKYIAEGNYEVDEETRKKAQEDISEDGYWGVKQTSQRMFDFASALAGDDVDKMKEMQAAIKKGYEAATKAWGRDLPSISNDTMDATDKLFEEYYKSKEQVV